MENGTQKNQLRHPVLPLLLLVLLLIPLQPIFSADHFTFQSDSLSSVMTEGREETILKGNAKVNTETLQIQADEIRLEGKKFRYIYCFGKVQLVDEKKKLNLSSERMEYDRDRKIGRFYNRVQVQDGENESLTKCDYLEYLENDETMTMQIGVRIVKKDIICRSEDALYNRKTNLLVLTGLPRVLKKDDEYKAVRILVNLKTEEVTLEGQVTGNIIPDDEKKDAKTPLPGSTDKPQPPTDLQAPPNSPEGSTKP